MTNEIPITTPISILAQADVVGSADSASGNIVAVLGITESVTDIGVLVLGPQKETMAILGGTDPFFKGAVGVYGTSRQNGVYGRTASSVPEDNAVFGQNDGAGHGVAGTNTTLGSSGFLAGLDPQFHQHAGVYGQSNQQGVMGLTTVPKGTGVYGGGTTAAGGDQIGVRGETFTGVGVQGHAFGQGLAGRFIGDVEVTGDIRLVNQDLAEDFFIAKTDLAEPGTVMALNPEGELQPCHRAYDKGVVGVISGAGDYKPAIVLGKQASQNNRQPIALVGKVYCKVDARFSPIEVGDLLTTSPTPGHAMKADDPVKALGTLIGKALRPLREGQGMIPILVALQ